MKKLVLLLLFFTCTITGCRSSEKGAEGYRKISAEEAMEIMEKESGYIILDVRTKTEYNKKHIEGAICISNGKIGSAPIEELPDKDQLILVYCRSGHRSSSACKKLVKLGYTNIVDFGGINSWNGPTVSGDN